MPLPSNTLLIEGSFEELADEFATYIDNVRKSQEQETSSLQEEIRPLVEAGEKDEVLKKLVAASSVLNAAPEKEFIAAYNLLFHLTRQSSESEKFLPRLCQYLTSPITSSPLNGSSLALSVLTTIFNSLPETSDTRYHVFLAILNVIKTSSSFDLLVPYLKSVPGWLSAWETDEEHQRTLYLQIADAAAAASEDGQAYQYLVRALHTFTTEETASDEARKLSVRAVTAALNSPSHFDFTDLTALDSVQALRQTDGTLSELLELFATESLDDYNSFKEEHEGWISSHELNETILERKMRLLTLTSLAASTQSRSLPYKVIATELQIPEEDVEMWVIDVIRAGLVEGKLSQLNQTFLIHRATYRVFGEKQWQEVQGRLDVWRGSLTNVLKLIRSEREKLIREKDREAREIESKLAGSGVGGQRRQQQQQQQREVDLGVE